MGSSISKIRCGTKNEGSTWREHASVMKDCSRGVRCLVFLPRSSLLASCYLKWVFCDTKFCCNTPRELLFEELSHNFWNYGSNQFSWMATPMQTHLAHFHVLRSWVCVC